MEHGKKEGRPGQTDETNFDTIVIVVYYSQPTFCRVLLLKSVSGDSRVTLAHGRPGSPAKAVRQSDPGVPAGTLEENST